MGKLTVILIVLLGLFIGVYTFISSSLLKKKLPPQIVQTQTEPQASEKVQYPPDNEELKEEEKSADFRMTLMYLHLISRLHCEEKGKPPTIKILQEEMKRQKITTFDAFFDSYPESGCGIRVSLNRYYLDQKPFRPDFQKVLLFPLSEKDRKRYNIQTQ